MLAWLGEAVEGVSWIVSITIFLVFAVYETVRPDKSMIVSTPGRWLGHFALYAVGLVILVQVAPARITPLLAEFGHSPTPFEIVGQSGGDVAVLVAGFLLIDLFLYASHRIHHRIYTLWRFHAVHHSDIDVDLTTTLRHHPLEFLLNAGLATVLFVALGLPAWVFPIYGVCSIASGLFQHLNAQLPPRIDRVLRSLLVTPAMHRSHHSADPAHYDYNYGNIFSIWDRVLGTHKVLASQAQQSLSFGVPEFTAPEFAGLRWALILPFRLRRPPFPASAEPGLAQPLGDMADG
jgi:sterol desaturase/sphingolipid hydroxylase (fatty acid hydroxylase superfamily)